MYIQEVLVSEMCMIESTLLYVCSLNNAMDAYLHSDSFHPDSLQFLLLLLLLLLFGLHYIILYVLYNRRLIQRNVAITNGILCKFIFLCFFYKC